MKIAMTKCVLPTLTIFSMLLASPLRADAPGEFATENVVADDSSSTQPAPEDVPSDDTSSTEEAMAVEPGEVQPATEDEGAPVGEASNEGASSAKRKMWQNIGLAVGAVAIAVTALILVSTNEGHHHHKHH